MSQQSACCLCQNPFSSVSEPRMMPQCQHNSCSGCLRLALSSRLSKVQCQFCLKEQSLLQAELESFPRNFILHKSLQSKKSPNYELPITEQQTGHCEIHRKDLEILCLSDWTRVCPHCALFGEHRDHQLRPVKQVEKLASQAQQEFESVRSRKAMQDSQMASPQFRNRIVLKISEHKNQLITEIKKKFAGLHQNLKLAQKKCFEDTAKQFKVISQQLAQLLRDQHLAQKEFKRWEEMCKQQLNKSSQLNRLEDKAKFCLGGGLECCLIGNNYLTDIQKRTQRIASVIDRLVSRIRISENTAVPNSLFNYLNIVSDPIASLSFSKTESPKRLKTEQCKLTHDVSSQHVLKEPESPTLRPQRRSCVSNERPRTKDHSALKRRSSKLDNPVLPVEDLVDEYCQNSLETLDLSGYSLLDHEIIEVINYVLKKKKIKGLKLVRNRMTNLGLAQVLQLLSTVTNLNLSFNQLSDQAVNQILTLRTRVPQLRIVNLSNNGINQRHVRNFIEQLKRQGVIITI